MSDMIRAKLATLMDLVSGWENNCKSISGGREHYYNSLKAADDVRGVIEEISEILNDPIN